MSHTYPRDLEGWRYARERRRRQRRNRRVGTLIVWTADVLIGLSLIASFALIALRP